MSKVYKSIKVICSQSLSELLIAELSQVGYDSFLEKDDGFETYIESGKFQNAELNNIFSKAGNIENINFYINEIEEKNWNEEWERHYYPVIINDTCLIRASFHKIEKNYPYEIIINPKMSFGTGHHDTTWLMIYNLLNDDHKYPSVMDAGCGTGILSILAEKRGAGKITAFDIDEWAIRNARENIQINNCTKIMLNRGNISTIGQNDKFNLILANINRNIILDDLPEYSEFIDDNGVLLCSGFFEDDISLIVHNAEKHNFILDFTNTRNQWASLVFKKKSR